MHPGFSGPKDNGRKRELPAVAVTAFATQGVVITARVSVLVSVWFATTGAKPLTRYL